MELEFDKEIDTILRKARDPAGVSVTAANAGHLDADTVAAFAENAVPPKAKLLYMEHFADCDRCRKLLSHAILTNSEAVAAAASPVVAPVGETTIPWYEGLFKTQNLALTMGALVLSFGAILGYLVLQNPDDAGSNVSQVADPERSKGGPYYSGDASANAANSNAANSTANAANMPMAKSPAMPSAMSNMAPATSSNTSARTGSAPGVRRPPEKERAFALDGVTVENPKPVAAAPPPTATDNPPANRDEKKAGDDKLKDDRKAATLSKTENRMDREAAPPSAKKSGPNRASGPRQSNQNQTETSDQSGASGMASSTKTVGRKTFDRHDGAWYDTAYHGQPTINVRRATDEFKKLDGGLRNIANTLGGTVVVVWKEKAYRIQ